MKEYLVFPLWVAGAYSGRKKVIIKIPLPKSTTKGKRLCFVAWLERKVKTMFFPVYSGEECATLATTEKGKNMG
ncbi:MAG: hypothetical protein IJQ65_08155, partial [Kiritimatiellae bacterium]|nr:hypothetical protein [Kiritimatiellia bacterium]